MKKWTVMVMPHNQGNTKTFHLYSGQVWALVGVLACFSFTTAFAVGRSQMAKAQAQQFRKINLELQAEVSRRAPETGLSQEEQAALEARIRAEYAAKDDKIKAELSELYDLEAQVRAIHGLPPRETAVVISSEKEAVGGGKGGAPDGEVEAVYAASVALERLLPPTVLEGIANPPADLVVEEIRVRTASLGQLLAALESQRELVARMPSIWPTRHPRAYISSGFGHRIDPFTRRLSRHDGVDFPAPYGSNVVATAHGEVKEAYYDRWLGNLVKINHGDGVETWYGHMSELSVHKGDTVDRGAVIGKVGSTGRSTGSHIHYEVHVNGKLVDPSKYLESR